MQESQTEAITPDVDGKTKELAVMSAVAEHVVDNPGRYRKLVSLAIQGSQLSPTLTSVLTDLLIALQNAEISRHFPFAGLRRAATSLASGSPDRQYMAHLLAAAVDAREVDHRLRKKQKRLSSRRRTTKSSRPRVKPPAE